ncbi:pentapeptide repeat-containing protein [Gilliamella apicola]|uniref:pentapeptide repeat-containing protein n=1 Tax=Gilliamella apicola TaxID=1196095 RepID=UPI003987F985
MTSNEMNEILKKHKIWLTSNGKNGGQIELAADLSYSQIVGTDLRCASLNNSNLTHAKLSYTNLKGAELSFCNLEWAELCYTNLERVNLSFSNLKNADLRYANLSHANLYRAVLQSANLRGADLNAADLRGADLSNADLRDVNLRDVDLSCPKLHRTILPESTFIILGEKYIISIYGDYVRASSCANTHYQNHLASEWRQFSKQDILDMDGEDTLKFYPRLLDIIDFYCGKGERPEWLKAQNNDL